MSTDIPKEDLIVRLMWLTCLVVRSTVYIYVRYIYVEYSTVHTCTVYTYTVYCIYLVYRCTV